MLENPRADVRLYIYLLQLKPGSVGAAGRLCEERVSGFALTEKKSI